MKQASAYAGAAAGNPVARILLVVVGAAAMVWAIGVLPIFSSEGTIVDVGHAVVAGEAFKLDVLTAIDAQVENNAGGTVRSSLLGKAAVIRLRLAEVAIRDGDSDRIDRSLRSLTQMIDEALQNAPSDPFLWLVRFWLDNARDRFRLSHLRELQMSYDLGRHEGWIAAKRNSLALAVYSSLPKDLAETAISEFGDLVRWGLIGEAADIAAGLGKPLRSVLFSRLKNLKQDQRSAFAQLLYRREVDDVLVPGIMPPPAPFPMPLFPPGF